MESRGPEFLEDLETPCLLLDRERLERNLRRGQERAEALGVALRPHLKTAKSAAVARLLPGPSPSPLTVSTLREAEYFAENGFADLFLAVPVDPRKMPRIARLLRPGLSLGLAVDHPGMLSELLRRAEEEGVDLEILVEIDSGQGRGGVPPGSPLLVELARRVHTHPRARLRGVFTHAGHAYEAGSPEEIRGIASQEREAIHDAARHLERADLPCLVRSVGSTPTFTQVDHLEGIHEARPGVYMFQDLHQLALGSCRLEDLALSVLTTVIGVRPENQTLLVDAGGLALSKDRSTRGLGSGDCGYGLVSDAAGELLPGARVREVCQEHGFVTLPSSLSPGDFPPGTRLRILPNHACMTAAAFPGYQVLESGSPPRSWPRVNGWR